MGDINDGHGGAAGATFPIAMYVIFLSYLTLILVPYSDLMHMASPMCVVKYKYTSACVMLHVE
jgi:nitrate reductase gamma subunit